VDCAHYYRGNRVYYAMSVITRMCSIFEGKSTSIKIINKPWPMKLGNAAGDSGREQ
jgi:hypothetical protein